MAVFIKLAKDVSQATKWYRKGADLGDEDCKKKLAELANITTTTHP